MIHLDTIKELKRSLKVDKKIRISEPPSIYNAGRPYVTEGVVLGKSRNVFIIDCGGYRKSFKYVTLLCKGVRWEQK